jgi:hypothetical protein
LGEGCLQRERTHERGDHEREHEHDAQHAAPGKVGAHDEPRQRGAQHGTRARHRSGEEQAPQQRPRRVVGGDDVEGGVTEAEGADQQVEERTCEQRGDDRARDQQ